MNDYPSEVFVHPNIDKCWQLVQKRVNMATQLHQCLGKVGLPPLREPDEVSGYELYGFTSPHIITVSIYLHSRSLSVSLGSKHLYHCKT